MKRDSCLTLCKRQGPTISSCLTLSRSKPTKILRHDFITILIISVFLFSLLYFSVSGGEFFSIIFVCHEPWSINHVNQMRTFSAQNHTEVVFSSNYALLVLDESYLCFSSQQLDKNSDAHSSSSVRVSAYKIRHDLHYANTRFLTTSN